MSSNWIIVSGFEKGDVEYWMYFHAWRKLQFISVGFATSKNFEFSKMLMVQSLGWACCSDVTARQPYFIADLEQKCRKAVFIPLLSLTCLCVLNFRT